MKDGPRGTRSAAQTRSLTEVKGALRILFIFLHLYARIIMSIIRLRMGWAVQCIITWWSSSRVGNTKNCKAFGTCIEASRARKSIIEYI